jgi:peptide chain release factor 1
MCAKIAYWDSIKQKYAELSRALTDATTLDRAKRQAMQREFSHLTQLVNKHEQVGLLLKQVAEIAEHSKAQADPDLAHLFKEEQATLEERLKLEQKELEELIAPPDEHDERSVFVEIRAGAGGQEAALFVSDLLKMYTNYALHKGWKVSIDSESHTDLGGFREIVLFIQGKGVFGHLKHESGVHRVQRVPATEGSGRVHTSTATVAVLPEAQDVDVTINPSDLRIDVYRASGAGGQHVNTTDSAVRITHIPTGVAVACQEERSQHKNKAKAMKMLQSRLLATQIEKQQAEMSQMRKEQVGTGMRAEKVRTYNFPQNRITDHQVEMTLQKLDMVMEGDLDEIIQALRVRAHELRRVQFLSQFR